MVIEFSQVAYDAYADFWATRSILGPYPKFSDLPQDCKESWEAVAKAIITAAADAAWAETDV